MVNNFLLHFICCAYILTWWLLHLCFVSRRLINNHQQINSTVDQCFDPLTSFPPPPSVMTQTSTCPHTNFSYQTGNFEVGELTSRTLRFFSLSFSILISFYFFSSPKAKTHKVQPSRLLLLTENARRTKKSSFHSRPAGPRASSIHWETSDNHFNECG